MAVALEIHQLKKHYGSLVALNNLELSISEGEFFGLLGPNGAGKTTLIKTIIGLARRTSGSIKVFGKDVEKDYLYTRKMIGVAAQEPNIDHYSPIQRVLEFQGGYHGMNKNDRREKALALLKQFGLIEKRKAMFKFLSGGMQRRVMIARSMMGSPKILILDEPSAGVDVEQRHELWNALRDVNKQGVTIILTTHYIDEAEELCERIGIINKGEIELMGNPQQLINKYCDQYFMVNGEKRKTLEGHDVRDVEVKQGSLEEVFLKVIGKSMHECEQDSEASKDVSL
ncbi:MAG: ABC transporter ATP-binding protein [Deltaproteobacteria bacterium CG_4_10_14_0_2_um_filter_43_8]|nr:MAG: ABC transporter ATP-binding protein [Deltaproteobacteria bacterium CG11_big_fil_rev_8_21_14_0_20_42_23]PJA21836.1 MAG: ABC transporter ATP-binding protein [Deltaproteobacteria bacterium CG_4_10_14_0_2_um_filter_43_8]PJC64001.1 MAG: ABC transporter ATP-binding protein [Deltaproteobacteria bacterium CG_4_9_14_0_2_um_filter_42_21]